MGGITSFYLSSQLPMIEVCIPFIGLPSFVHEWESICKNHMRNSRSIDLAYMDQIKQYLLEIDPFYRLEQFAPKPLLIINAIQDKSVSIKYSEIFYKHIFKYYRSAPHHLKFSKYNVDHRIVKEMITEASQFFTKYL